MHVLILLNLKRGVKLSFKLLKIGGELIFGNLQRLGFRISLQGTRDSIVMTYLPSAEQLVNSI